MTKVRVLSKALLCTALLAGVGTDAAQGSGIYDLSWYTVSAGGGLSEGGIYRVAGVTGQPAAHTVGPLSGGIFTITPGFLQDYSLFPVPVTVSQFAVE